MGLAYDDLQDYNNALVAFKKSAEILPEYDEAHYNIGVSYQNLKDYNNAIEEYKKAVEINPRNSDAYYNMGIAYGVLKDYDNAINAYQKAAELNPANADSVYYNLSITYGNVERYDEALQCINRAIEINPTNEKYRQAQELIINLKNMNNGGAAYNALVRYYTAIAEGNTRESFDMLTTDMQNYMRGYETYWRGHDGVISNNVQNGRVISADNYNAVIEYTLYSESMVNGRVVHKIFQGTAALKLINNRWLITDLRVREI